MSNLKNVKIVLVETSHPGNIGAAARAMKTMGLCQMVLVSPHSFPDPKATARAAAAADVLHQAVVVSSLAEAVADCSQVFGTSARARKMSLNDLDARQCAKAVVTKANQPIAVVFGNESRGLTNEQLGLCQYHIHVPTNPDCSSLNLGSAVQIVAYELRMAVLGQADLIPEDTQEYPCGAELDQYYSHLEQVLAKIGFLKGSSAVSALFKLQCFYNRARPTKKELAMLRGMLTKIQKYHH